MTKISVIVPVYNVERYLKRCLDSIVNQTFDDYEVIVVNDCSPDNSQSIIDDYVDRYPDKVRSVVNEVNIGLGKTREHGLSVAKGEYVTFIDSDDYIREDYLETYYNAMVNEKVDVVIGGYTRDVDGDLKPRYFVDSYWSIVSTPIACAKLYKKSLFDNDQISFPNIRCGEDIYFSLTVYCSGVSYKVIPYVGYCYYFNRESITGRLYKNNNLEEFIKAIFTEFLNNYDITQYSKQVQDVIEYDYIANMINALVTYGFGIGISEMRKKYNFWMDDMKEKFPNYKKNPYVGIFKPKDQSPKIRLGVGVIMTLHKVKLDKALLYLISLI